MTLKDDRTLISVSIIVLYRYFPMTRIENLRISQVVQIRDRSDVLGSLLPTLSFIHTKGAFYVAYQHTSMAYKSSTGRDMLMSP